MCLVFQHGFSSLFARSNGGMGVGVSLTVTMRTYQRFRMQNSQESGSPKDQASLDFSSPRLAREEPAVFYQASTDVFNPGSATRDVSA